MKARSAYSRATRMAATFLAKLNGADAAATAFGIDPRTVRSWMGTVEVADDQWTAIRDVLLARGAEMAALGKTAGLPAILTGAGISDRNVRYGQLVARREARRDGAGEVPLHDRRRAAWLLFEYPNSGPERVPVIEEDEERLRKYMHCAVETIAESIREELSRRAYAETTPREGEEPYQAEAEGFGDPELLLLGEWVQLRKVADESEHTGEFLTVEPPDDLPAALAVPTDAMTDDEYTEWLAKLRPICIAKAREWWPSYVEWRDKKREEFADKAREAAEERERQRIPASKATPELVEAPEPAPTPIRRAPAAPRPVPMVMDVGRSEPWYDLDTGERRPWYR